MLLFRALATTTSLLFLPAESFQTLGARPLSRRHDSRRSHLMVTPKSITTECLDENSIGRRLFIFSAGFSTVLATQSLTPTIALAGIDVSGLRMEGGGDSSTIAGQLKSYDGSGTARVQEIKAAQNAKANSALAPSTRPAIADTGSAATYAVRSGGLPSLRPLGIGVLNRYEGYVLAPPGSKLRQIPISFDFPSDWLQLDKLGGGVQYVDQRNGDKLYILRAPLPEGANLATVPKAFFADAIFDPRGDIARSGTVVEGGKVVKSNLIDECPDASCITRRRLLLKYDTVTGSGVQTVERRGLVDAYEVDGDVYMLMTSSNAVKFEAKGKERETVEAIVKSFRLGI